MTTPVVAFDHVWKKFRRGERHDSLRDLLPSLIKGAGRKSPDDVGAAEFWAVRDVSFEVGQGEAFGIIGPNGAGKSTTLKLLTKILRPNRGTASVKGRVGALIEVAAGFHPDLTGRENIFLQGAVMGMKRSDIERRLDDIIEFAGVRDFVDTQVKRYSSGMNARLGFSIAAHLDPEVLIIDEVLSVGDMAFQERCIERMREFKRAGVTIVFVSHNLQAVADLCDRAMCLERTCRAIGPTTGVIETYVSGSRHNAATGQGEVEIARSSILGRSSEGTIVVSPGEQLQLRVDYRCHAAISELVFGFIVYRTTDNLVVYDGNVVGHAIGIGTTTPGEVVTVDYSFRPHLTRGQYYVELHVFHGPTQRFLSRLAPAVSLTVQETQTYAGIADIELRGALVSESAKAGAR